MFNPGDKAYYTHENDGKEYLVEIAMSIPNCYIGSDGYLVYMIDKFEIFGGHSNDIMTNYTVDHFIRCNNAIFERGIFTRPAFSRLIKEEFLRMAGKCGSNQNMPPQDEEDNGGFHLI
jgi:hypothetical protein